MDNTTCPTVTILVENFKILWFNLLLSTSILRNKDTLLPLPINVPQTKEGPH